MDGATVGIIVNSFVAELRGQRVGAFASSAKVGAVGSITLLSQAAAASGGRGPQASHY